MDLTASDDQVAFAAKQETTGRVNAAAPQTGAEYLEALRDGARLVSHHHPMPGWTPTGVDRENRVYLYRWPEAKPIPGAPPGVTGGT